MPPNVCPSPPHYSPPASITPTFSHPQPSPPGHRHSTGCDDAYAVHREPSIVSEGPFQPQYHPASPGWNSHYFGGEPYAGPHHPAAEANSSWAPPQSGPPGGMDAAIRDARTLTCLPCAGDLPPLPPPHLDDDDMVSIPRSDYLWYVRTVEHLHFRLGPLLLELEDLRQCSDRRFARQRTYALLPPSECFAPPPALSSVEQDASHLLAPQIYREQYTHSAPPALPSLLPDEPDRVASPPGSPENTSRSEAVLAQSHPTPPDPTASGSRRVCHYPPSSICSQC